MKYPYRDATAEELRLYDRREELEGLRGQPDVLNELLERASGIGPFIIQTMKPVEGPRFTPNGRLEAPEGPGLYGCFYTEAEDLILVLRADTFAEANIAVRDMMAALMIDN